MLQALDRASAALARAAAIIGTLGLVGQTVVICVDVIGRYFGSPIYGAQDITSMSLVIVVFGGMSICDRNGGHIMVDVFESPFPEWLNRTGDIVAATLGAVVFGFIAWTMWDAAGLSRMLGLATNIIDLPKSWFQYVIVVAALITAFGMLLRAIALSLGVVLHQQEMRE